MPELPFLELETDDWKPSQNLISKKPLPGWLGPHRPWFVPIRRRFGPRGRFYRWVSSCAKSTSTIWCCWADWPLPWWSCFNSL